MHNLIICVIDLVYFNNGSEKNTFFVYAKKMNNYIYNFYLFNVSGIISTTNTKPQTENERKPKILFKFLKTALNAIIFTVQVIDLVSLYLYNKSESKRYKFIYCCYHIMSILFRVYLSENMHELHKLTRDISRRVGRNYKQPRWMLVSIAIIIIIRIFFIAQLTIYLNNNDLISSHLFDSASEIFMLNCAEL